MEALFFLGGMIFGGAICFFACITAIDEFKKRNNGKYK